MFLKVDNVYVRNECVMSSGILFQATGPATQILGYQVEGRTKLNTFEPSCNELGILVLQKKTKYSPLIAY